MRLLSGQFLRYAHKKKKKKIEINTEIKNMLIKRYIKFIVCMKRNYYY